MANGATSCVFGGVSDSGAAWDALHAVQNTVDSIWSAYGAAAQVNAAAAEVIAAASLRLILCRLDPQRKRVRNLRCSDRARVAIHRADARSLYDALVFELQRRMSVARRRVGAFRTVEHRFRHRNRHLVSTRCGDEAGGVLVDFAVLRDCAARGDMLAVRAAGARRCSLGAGLASAASAWTLDAHPGFVFIQGALSPCAQLDWARRCMGWAEADDAVTNQRPLESIHGDVDGSSASAIARGGDQRHTRRPARSGELTWATLGLHWDWERRGYIETSSERGFANSLPREMAELSVAIAGATGHAGFVPEAAILNFYTLPRHARMGGHRDDGENARAAPVISISVGHAGKCTTIILS